MQAGMPPAGTPVPVSQRRRRPRLSADEMAQRMYEAAREILFQQGITVTLEDLALDDVIARAGVPRSSVYRRWPYKSDFVADLLVDLAGPNWMAHASFDEQTLATVIGVVTDGWDTLATPEGRRAVFVELVRVGVTQNFAALLESSQWYVFYTLCVTARPPTPDVDDENRAKVVTAVHAAAEAYIDVMAKFYEALGGVLGLRPKAPYTMRHVVTAATAVIEGLAVNELVARANVEPDPSAWSLSEVVTGTLTHPDGYPGAWSLPALAYLAILDSMQESDPQWAHDELLRDNFQATLAPNAGSLVSTQP